MAQEYDSGSTLAPVQKAPLRYKVETASWLLGLGLLFALTAQFNIWFAWLLTASVMGLWAAAETNEGETKWYLYAILAIVVFTYLPIAIHGSSVWPPGDDAARLAVEPTGHVHKLNIITAITGVPLFYFSTPLLAFAGLTVYWWNEDRKLKLIGWFLCFTLFPALYFNLIAGSWLTVVNFFLTSLTLTKLTANLIDCQDGRWFIPILGLGLLAPLLHFESSAYAAAGVGTFLLLTRRFHLLPILIPLICGMAISMFVLGSRADNLLLQENKDVIVEVIETGQKTHVGETQLKSDAPIVLPGGSRVTRSDVVEVETGSSWWLEFQYSWYALPFTIFIGSVTFMAIQSKLPMGVSTQTKIMLSAIPLIVFFSWSPWHVSPTRLTIYMTVIIGLLLAELLIQLWNHYGHTKWFKTQVASTLAVMAFVNAPNTWLLWISFG